MTTTDPVPIGEQLRTKALGIAGRHQPVADDDPPRVSSPPRARTRWDAMPARFAHARLDDLEAGEVLDDLTTWSTSTDTPSNLLLLGPVGAGKTHAAVAACRPHVDDGADVEFVPVVDLLDRLDWRRPDSHTYLERCCTVDLLVVDDLGTERANEWSGERLYAIVNRRWLELLPTVGTSNLEPTGPDGLDTVLGERTFSRLVGGATILRMTGRDRRRRP